MKKIVTDKKRGMLAGVCSGLEITTNIDVTLIRLGFIILLVIAFPLGFIAYISLAIIAPDIEELQTRDRYYYEDTDEIR